MSIVDASQLKEIVRQSFRRACLKRLEGCESGAENILEEEVPSQLKAWQSSAECTLSEIDALLSEELAKAEQAKWIVSQVEKKVLDAIDSRIEAMQTVIRIKLEQIDQQLELWRRDQARTREADLKVVQRSLESSMEELLEKRSKNLKLRVVSGD